MEEPSALEVLSTRPGGATCYYQSQGAMTDSVADVRSEEKHTKALIIEDIRIITAELRHRGYVRDRITRIDLMSCTGSQY